MTSGIPEIVPAVESTLVIVENAKPPRDPNDDEDDEDDEDEELDDDREPPVVREPDE